MHVKQYTVDRNQNTYMCIISQKGFFVQGPREVLPSVVCAPCLVSLTKYKGKGWGLWSVELFLEGNKLMSSKHFIESNNVIQGLGVNFR